MKLLVNRFYVLVLVLGLGDCAGNDVGRLVRTLDALTKSLDYLQSEIDKINLDAVFGVRKVQEQLQSLLTFEPEVIADIRHWVEVLRDKAKIFADEGLKFVNITQPGYVIQAGTMTREAKKLAWYPSQRTSARHTDVPVNCSDYFYDAQMENYCYARLSGAIGNTCDVTPKCFELNTIWNHRLYGLTHEVLFWQAMEANACVESIPKHRRIRFCSNVMRDANIIAAAGFPNTHVDLFLEQIGLCGIWGFIDFSKPEWLEKILEWQEPSGCYSTYGRSYCFDELPKESHKRVKREEKRFKDGCLSHETTVAMLALAVNVRFEAEKAYQKNETLKEVNALLNGNQTSL